MKTIAEIAKEAFDGVSAEIGDAIVTATIGAVTGRAVFEREKSPKGMPTPSDDARLQSVWLEGFTVAPEYADTMTSGGVDFFVMGVNNLMQSGGFYNVMAIGVDELLNTSIIVKRASRVSDGAGGYDETWASHATVNGGVTNIGGSEGWNYGRVTSDASVRVILEYTADLTVKDALLFDGKYHNISYIDNSQNRGKWLVVDCMEGVAQRASEPETAPTAPVNTLAPSITPASANDGDILTLDEGLWTGSPTPTLTAQWLRNGTAISGATGLTLDTTGYGGDRISAYVLGSNAIGSSVAVSSNAVDVAAGAPTGATITGFSRSAVDGDRTVFWFEISGSMGVSGSSITDVKALIVGAGGAGGWRSGGGGGGGRVFDLTSQTIDVGSYPVVIGAGSVIMGTQVRGGDTAFFATDTYAYGGGNGGNYATGGYFTGSDGGSGGGGSFGNTGFHNAGGAALDDQGGMGFYGEDVGSSRSSGGGGSTSTSQQVEGTGFRYGGLGYTSDITGVNEIYGAGGAAGGYGSTTGGAVDGYGDSNQYATANGTTVNGRNGYGSGGGGDDRSGNFNNLIGGFGGNGVVIISVPTSQLAGA